MADQKTAGFMAALGIPNTEQLRSNQVRGGSMMADAANISRTAGRGPATQLLGGAVRGVAGLVRPGEEGRGVRQFGQDFAQGVNDVRDGAIARDQGITVEKLRNRRALKKELDGISVGEGTLEEQINAAQEIAKKANASGDISIALNAAQMAAQLRKQLEQQKQAGIESEKAGIELEELKAEEDIGMRASVQGRDDLGEGKAVRLDAERAQELGFGPDSIGKFLFVDKDGNRTVVDGVDLVPSDKTALGVGGIAPKDDNILKLAAANGATTGNITKMRGSLNDMGRNADILLDVSTMLQGMSNPEFALDLTGKAAIKANKVVSFVDNASKILTEADKGAGSSEKLGQYEYNGKKVAGPAEQHQMFVNKGKEEGFLLRTLNSISGSDKGDITEYLPEALVAGLNAKGASVAQIAQVAEQYFANVMELAYMDARLQEPSNRGLSDKDIENALRRIGAATANPASFAQRQQVMLGRLDDAVSSLGSLIQVPRGANTLKRDVVDFIYNPEVRASVKGRIGEARESLQGLRADLQEPQPNAPAGPSPVDTLFQRAQAGENLTAEDVNALTLEQLQDLQQRIRATQGQQ